MELVTIKASHLETDLLVLKAKLESEGIQCYMKNEFTTQVMSHMATFAVELQVAEEDADRAREIMEKMEEQQ